MTHFHGVCAARVGRQDGQRAVLLEACASRCHGEGCEAAEDGVHPELTCWPEEADALEAAAARQKDIGVILARASGVRYSESPA